MAIKIGVTVTKYLKLKDKISEHEKVKLGSVNISEVLFGQCDVADQAKLLKYAQTKKAMQLVTIGLSQAAYREMIESGKKFSFIKPFMKKRLTKGVKRG